ncbi:MAG TPA: GNAT family N-acetyltransferase [Candidatus Limnocylindria bacterium]
MTAAPPALRVRPARAEDESFLWRMLATTANLPPAEPPPVEHVRRDPGIAPYLAGWGRAGDAGVVAEMEGARVGAAWYRLFDADHPGYGFVDSQVPEISIGVEPAWRGRGVGRALLQALVATARADGHRTLSLSVDARNAPALALYRSIGFIDTGGGSAENPTMLLRLLG